MLKRLFVLYLCCYGQLLYGQVGKVLPIDYDTSAVLRLLERPLKEAGLPAEAFYTPYQLLYHNYQHYRLVEVVWTPNFCSNFITDCLLMKQNNHTWQVIYAERVEGYGLAGEIKLLPQWTPNTLSLHQIATNGTNTVIIALQHPSISPQRSGYKKWVVVLGKYKKLAAVRAISPKVAAIVAHTTTWVLAKKNVFFLLVEAETEEMANGLCKKLQQSYPKASVIDANLLCQRIDYAYSYKAGEETVQCLEE